MNPDLRNFTISRTLFIASFAIIEQFGIVHFYLLFDKNLEFAIGLYIILHLGYALVLPLLMRIIEKTGVRNSMLIGIIFAFLSTVPLFFSTGRTYLLLIWVMLEIIWRSFYFVPFHYFTNKFTSSKHRGSEIGIINGMAIFAMGVTPLISGYVSEAYNLAGIAMLAACLSLLAIVPLLRLENFHFIYNNKLRSVIAAPGMLKMLLLLSLNFAQENINKIWYIFLFLFFSQDFSEFGLITTIAIFISAIISYLFGRFLDHHNRKTIIHYESILNSLAWGLRFIVNTPLGLITAETLYKVNKYIKDDAVDVINVDIISRQHHDESLDERITVRQIFANLAIALTLLIALLAIRLTGEIKTAFLVSVLLSFLFYLVK